MIYKALRYYVSVITSHATVMNAFHLVPMFSYIYNRPLSNMEQVVQTSFEVVAINEGFYMVRVDQVLRALSKIYFERVP